MLLVGVTCCSNSGLETRRKKKLRTFNKKRSCLGCHVAGLQNRKTNRQGFCPWFRATGFSHQRCGEKAEEEVKLIWSLSALEPGNEPLNAVCVKHEYYKLLIRRKKISADKKKKYKSFPLQTRLILWCILKCISSSPIDLLALHVRRRERLISVCLIQLFQATNNYSVPSDSSMHWSQYL